MKDGNYLLSPTPLLIYFHATIIHKNLHGIRYFTYFLYQIDVYDHAMHSLISFVENAGM